MDRSRIHAPQRAKHSEEISFLTNLIIDMKLTVAGVRPFSPITEERLKLASECIQKISECTEDAFKVCH